MRWGAHTAPLRQRQATPIALRSSAATSCAPDDVGKHPLVLRDLLKDEGDAIVLQSGHQRTSEAAWCPFWRAEGD